MVVVSVVRKPADNHLEVKSYLNIYRSILEFLFYVYHRIQGNRNQQNPVRKV